jgi:Xaa-Pro dipeptidase
MSQTDRYRSHLATLDQALAAALERAGHQGLALDGVFFHAGRARYRYADDNQIHFTATPHFRRWTPMPGPEHILLARPGRPPLVVRVQPRDYWYDSTPPPPSYWEPAVDLHEAGSYEQAVAIARDAVGGFERFAYVGDSPEAAGEAGFPAERIDPPALLAPLDWSRAYKTEHEVELMREACRRGAKGHLAARDAFLAGASELEIHWAYLRGTGHVEADLPFDTIAAVDEKAATLHYHPKRGPGEARGDLLLMDAGAACDGYASDLTRTWALPRVDPTFRALLLGVDSIEQELVAMVTPGRPYLEIHLEAHRKVAELLIEAELVTCSADEAIDLGITRAFFPHGVGHHLGIQVHDVGGHQAGPEGGTVPPPAEHPYLRNTRIIEPGHVLTIEPGIYFIEMLLEPVRDSAAGGHVHWPLVAKLGIYGGIRIEDNVVCREGGPEDLSRPLLPGP